MNKKFLIFILFFLPALYLSGGQIDDMLDAYKNSRFNKAYEIAEKNLDKPVANLVYNLCKIYNKENRNIESGIKGLEKIYENNNTSLKIWNEAALSYGRIVQYYQLRGNSKYKDIDVVKIYKKIIEKNPDSVKSSIAMVYMLDYYLNKNELSKGIREGEKFIKTYTGLRKDTVMVHLYLDMLYINLNKNYLKSFEHLEAAYKIGITRGITKETVLFRLGRISDKRLHNKARAKYYYKEYLRLYPGTDRTPIVERYLKEIH